MRCHRRHAVRLASRLLDHGCAEPALRGPLLARLSQSLRVQAPVWRGTHLHRRRWSPAGGHNLRQSVGEPGVSTSATEGLGLDLGIRRLWLLVLPPLDLAARLLTDGIAYDGPQKWLLHDCPVGGRDPDGHLDWWLASRLAECTRIRLP